MLKDGTKAMLINLDQSKAFNRVDYRFLASVLETAGFKLEFCRWISMMLHKRKAFGGVRDRALGPAWLSPVSPSLCPCFGAPALKA